MTPRRSSAWPTRSTPKPCEPDAHSCHHLSGIRSRRHLDRTVRDPMVCAGLYQRHRARMDLCALADQETSDCGAGRRRSRRCSSTTSFSGSPSASSSAAAPATCCSTILAFFIQHPAAIFKLWEGGMSFHGGFLGCVAAVMLFARKNDISILSLGDITTAVATDRNISRPARQLHQQRAVGSRRRMPACPGRMVFPDGGPLFAPSEPAL